MNNEYREKSLKTRLIIAFIILIIISLGIWGYSIWNKSNKSQNTYRNYKISSALGSSDTTGFKKAMSVRKFHFPKDNGPHPDYKNEWWYYTGNLETANGRHFGYQFTLFRIGLKPGKAQSASDWATHQFYMADLALSDIHDHKFYAFQKFSRSALGLAGAQSTPFHIWIDNWQVKGDSERIPKMHITAKEKNIALNLHLISQKPPVLEGDKGLSRKGAKPGDASYYYSLTHLNTNGTVKVNQKSFKVKGLSWMDREWSTNMLDKNQSGWDWFSIQLDNDWEIMYYQLRMKNGQPDTTSSGKLIRPDGSTINLPFGSVRIKVKNHWISPATATNYPSGWVFSIPGRKIHLNIEPYMKNQELKLSVKYWEGAVKIKGEMAGKKVKGNGYVELTGYTREKQN